MHVNEKARACRCGMNYPSAAAVFVSEHPGETVFRPLSPYTAGGPGGPVAAAREPVLLAGGVSQLGLPADRTEQAHGAARVFYIRRDRVVVTGHGGSPSTV